jgi:hypothetical protein
MNRQLVLIEIPPVPEPATAERRLTTSAETAPTRLTQAEINRRGAEAARTALRAASQRAAARDAARRAARQSTLFTRLGVVGTSASPHRSPAA